MDDEYIEEYDDQEEFDDDEELEDEEAELYSDENTEYDQIVLSHLESLSTITVNLYNTYQRLIYIESEKKEEPYYQALKELLIESIRALKRSEYEEYAYFSEDCQRAIYALDYLEDKYDETSDLMDHAALLCFSRVHGKLEHIELEDGINQDYEEPLERIKKTRKYKEIIKSGLEEIDAVFIYLDYSWIIDNSISLRYISLLEDEIKSHPGDKDYIKMYYEESFASSNDLEDSLLKYGFGHVPRNLDDELTPPYEMNDVLRKTLIRLEIDDSLLDIVNKINHAETKTEQESCIILFKTYLLYLEPYDVKKVIGLLESVLQRDDLRERLEELVYQHETFRKQQNVDKKGNQFS